MIGGGLKRKISIVLNRIKISIRIIREDEIMVERVFLTLVIGFVIFTLITGLLFVENFDRR